MSGPEPSAESRLDGNPWRLRLGPDTGGRRRANQGPGVGGESRHSYLGGSLGLPLHGGS